MSGHLNSYRVVRSRNAVTRPSGFCNEQVNPLPSISACRPWRSRVKRDWSLFIHVQHRGGPDPRDLEVGSIACSSRRRVAGCKKDGLAVTAGPFRAGEVCYLFVTKFLVRRMALMGDQVDSIVSQ